MKYNTDEWYNAIDELQKSKTFYDTHELWYKIFHAYCKVFDMCDTAINVLFYNFHMENWKAMHKENTEYAEYSLEQLLKDFKSDVSYCSDRMSLDRLFRNHWKFRQVFEKEIPK